VLRSNYSVSSAAPIFAAKPDVDPITPNLCPFLIGSVRPEVIVVPLKSHTGITEKRWKLSAQISISKKY
jgi:hypothetical protein